jgi:pimeloyl-ACP methyl ester carboxylesterase
MVDDAWGNRAPARLERIRQMKVQVRPLVAARTLGAMVAVATLCAIQPAAPAAAAAPAARGVEPTARQAFAELPGVRLWFTDTGGNGEPVVLMHAITGTSETWQPQIDALASAGYRVITFDRRGWGKSRADATTGPQPGHAAEDLNALADYLSIGRFHLVGVAGGGFVALDYAAWQGARLRSLVVGASTGSVSDAGIQELIARIEIPGLRGLAAHYREVGASYRGANPQGVQRWLEIEEHARQPNAPAQPLRSPNTFAKLATMKVRMLVMPGDADLIAPPGLMWVWANYVKDARWMVVPAAGHSIAWEKPEIFQRDSRSLSARRRRLPARAGRAEAVGVRFPVEYASALTASLPVLKLSRR